MFSKNLPITLDVNFIFWGRGDDINVTPGKFEINSNFSQSNWYLSKSVSHRSENCESDLIDC